MTEEIKTESVTVTDLVILKNIQEFEWNFSVVKQKIQSDVEKYVGLVVTEENLKDMELAQKEIASIRTKVDGFRKAVKKEMEKPYKLFEGEIKELLQLIEKAEAPLKNQTLQYEKDRIIVKEVELNKFAQTTATSMGVRPEYFKIVIPSQWTNRTARDSAVRKEIVSQVEVMLDSQRKDDEAKEIAKQRIGLIDGQCQVHSAGLKTPVVPADVNHLLIGVTLSDIPGIILAECQKRAEMERKAAEPVPEVHEYVEGTDQHHEWIPEINYQEENYILPEPLQHEYGNQNLHVPASFIAPPVPTQTTSFSMPPLPPMPRSVAPMPPAPQQPRVFKCVIEYPNITASEGTAIKEFLSSRGISYVIISQEELRSDF